jgi:hypothetical protein
LFGGAEVLSGVRALPEELDEETLTGLRVLPVMDGLDTEAGVDPEAVRV